jgi:uncharacterized protein YggE
MSKKILILSSILVFAVLLSACGGNATAPQVTSVLAADDVDGIKTRTLSVSGTGRVTLTPDIAYVTIGVQTEAKDAAESVAENNSKTQGVIDALDAAGVDSKDIKTTNFSIYPQQQYDDRGKPTGDITYVVNNSVYVTVRDLDTIGDLLNAAVAAGANTIQGIQFDVDDKTEALAEAQEKAVANAQAQAENLADASGVALGQILSINTFGGAVPFPRFDGIGGGVMLAEAAPVPVSPGEMTINVEVSMVYEIQ